MSTKYFKYREIQNVPEYLNSLEIIAAHVPEQKGFLEHYAFLNKNEQAIFCCSSLKELVAEGWRRIENANIEIHHKLLSKYLTSYLHN